MWLGSHVPTWIQSWLRNSLRVSVDFVAYVMLRGSQNHVPGGIDSGPCYLGSPDELKTGNWRVSILQGCARLTKNCRLDSSFKFRKPRLNYGSNIVGSHENEMKTFSSLRAFKPVFLLFQPDDASGHSWNHILASDVCEMRAAGFIVKFFFCERSSTNSTPFQKTFRGTLMHF